MMALFRVHCFVIFVDIAFLVLHFSIFGCFVIIGNFVKVVRNFCTAPLDFNTGHSFPLFAPCLN